MTVSKSPRFGLTRWDNDNDPWSRDDWDDDNAAVEALGAIAREGTLAARGSAATWARSTYRVTAGTSAGNIYYSNGAAWLNVTRPESYAFLYGPSASNNPINEVGWQPAGVEMAYVYADAPNEAGYPNPPTNLPAWLTIQNNPANAQPGRLTLAAGGRYVINVAVKFEDLENSGTVFAVGYVSGPGVAGWTPGQRPTFVLPPHSHTAAMATLLGTSSTALTMELNATVSGDTDPVDFLPVVYLDPITDPDTGGSSQRQIQSVYISIVRHAL